MAVALRQPFRKKQPGSPKKVARLPLSLKKNRSVLLRDSADNLLLFFSAAPHGIAFRNLHTCPCGQPIITPHIVMSFFGDYFIKNLIVYKLLTFYAQNQPFRSKKACTVQFRAGLNYNLIVQCAFNRLFFVFHFGKHFQSSPIIVVLS